MYCLYRILSKEIRKENILVWYNNIKDIEIKRLLNILKLLTKNCIEINFETCNLAKQLNVKNKNAGVKRSNTLDIIYSIDIAGRIDLRKI